MLKRRVSLRAVLLLFVPLSAICAISAVLIGRQGVLTGSYMAFKVGGAILCVYLVVLRKHRFAIIIAAITVVISLVPPPVPPVSLTDARMMQLKKRILTHVRKSGQVPSDVSELISAQAVIGVTKDAWGRAVLVKLEKPNRNIIKLWC